MAQNPLLGNRISLISKKNIRYEGTLYSINEANATVALQNVRSFGTEGRETMDPGTTFVAPQDTVHPYLLFRGCDIKDLHVHEAATEMPPAVDPAIVAAGTPPAANLPPPPPAPAPPSQESAKDEKENQNVGKPPQQQQQPQQPQQQQPKSQKDLAVPNRRPKKPNPAIGTGASLLHRTARGSVDGVGPDSPDEEFDFQSKLKEFAKGDDNHDDDEPGDEGHEGNTAYDKDDFFDSISCDALDRENGVDSRLRGRQERTLNTETFGAVALNSRRRRGRGPGPGRGGGWGWGRGGRAGDNDGGGESYNGGRGRGRGGGRGRGRSGGRGRGGRGRGRQYDSNTYQSSSLDKVSASK